MVGELAHACLWLIGCVRCGATGEPGTVERWACDFPRSSQLPMSASNRGDSWPLLLGWAAAGWLTQAFGNCCRVPGESGDMHL